MKLDFSIVEFGSKSRGTSDQYSDNDLLVVTENKAGFDYSILEKYTTNEEYSISYYNYDKLKFLANSGSLFLLHLKKEGKVIEDQNQRFEKIIENYRPKESYFEEIDKTKRHLDFVTYIPISDIGKYWFCDCIYVLLRNFLVFDSANKKDYIFSYLDLLKGIFSEGLINASEYENLKELRVIKQSYRARNLNQISSDYILGLQETFSKMGLDIPTKFRDIKDVRDDMLIKINSELFDPYQKLRILECIYICSKNKNSVIENLIKNPQFYAQKFKKSTEIKKYLRLID